VTMLPENGAPPSNAPKAAETTTSAAGDYHVTPEGETTPLKAHVSQVPHRYQSAVRHDDKLKPGQPTALWVGTPAPRVVVDWKPPVERVSSYVVLATQHHPDKSRHAVTGRLPEGTTRVTVPASKLKAGATYTFQVASVLNDAHGPPSLPSASLTLPTEAAPTIGLTAPDAGTITSQGGPTANTGGLQGADPIRGQYSSNERGPSTLEDPITSYQEEDAMAEQSGF